MIEGPISNCQCTMSNVEGEKKRISNIEHRMSKGRKENIEHRTLNVECRSRERNENIESTKTSH
ncbi:MAG: hypothetical protein C4576_18805 [Desulfobacteraceae bacterium]|nr:MAG: hypothetical protein C4576_18805 [Desulfobacteraceae bacterium]